MKKPIIRVYYSKYKPKTSPYPPLIYNKLPTLSFQPENTEYDNFFFVTNTELPFEKVVISYEKRGNAENYLKEAKYDMAVGHLLLKSFWANEAVFQMMMLSYNLFLLFKLYFLCISEYRQQIKIFSMK